MAHYDPQEAFEVLKDRLSATIKSQFPVEGKKHQLVATKVWVDDNHSIDDVRSQKEARLKERTWAVPVRAEFELRDKETGKVKDRQSLTVAQLPKITNRYTYIVGGNEWQVNNLFRLKSGVYTHIKENGELASQWNLAKGLNFNMDFDPKSKKMTINFTGTGSHIPLYPVLKTLGVDDDTIERQWGREILNANKKEKEDAALKRFYKTFKGQQPADLEQAKQLVLEEFGNTKLRPEATKLTLGKPFEKVDGQALMAGANRILQVSRGEAEPDDRDSLEFKDLYSTEDLLSDRLERKHKWNILRKLRNTLDKNSRVRDVVNPDIFGKPVKAFFSQGSLSELPDELNPMSFIGGNRRTTIRGEGGIQKAHQVTIGAKIINPSHTGFLDPIQTPESEKIGTTLQLALGVRKVGHSIEIPAINAKTGKTEWIDPTVALHSTLAFPDQYKKEGGRLTPIAGMVKATDPKGKVTIVKPSKVDYILNSSKAMFDLSANLIPFLQSNQGNRAMMAAKQLEQAVSIKEREVPLVQVKSEGNKTFEQIVGGFTSHSSPVDGKVLQVKGDGVIIRDSDGKRHEVQLYQNFPLNDDKSQMHSTSLVKAGDTVKKGQVVADTNFTKDGTLALGTNLRVAYMPYKGYNYDDGIVISNSASQKLTSEHLFRSSASAEKNIILNKKKLNAEIGAVTPKEVMDKLDEEAVIKPGSTVKPGDILIGSMRHEELTPEQQKIALFSKRLVKPVRPRPVTWDKEVEGTVSQVVKHGKKITVYVKAEAPADIGDKIVGRHGNKGIITNILPDYEMPKTKDGEHAEVLLNPTGVPSRINVGQILETTASKIAKKTGKPYVVNNFDSAIQDYTRQLKKDLEKNGLSDTEEMFDPTTGKSLGQVLTGDQYILKLHHTAAKGLSARFRDAYDSNMTPRKGGPHGGQTMDAMGLYAMLAHNARENIREIQTYKCFLRRTTVETEQGPMLISTIVNGKLPVRVLSWNPEKLKLEYRPILNYWKRRIDTPLVKVEFMARGSDGEFLYAATKCTEGHEFHTCSEDGIAISTKKEKAKDLEGKFVLTPGLVPDVIQYQVLSGSLLGDGHLSKRHHYFPAFQERHCEAQRDYLEFKADILRDFSARDVRGYNAGLEGFNVGQTMYEWGTLAQPAFIGLYRQFYKDGKKHVPLALDHHLSPLSVAIWYQDDGSLTHGNHQRVLKLHTGNFDCNDRKRLINGLKEKIGVTFTESPNNSSWDLRLGKKDEIDKFLDYVAPYIHPSMAYKADNRPVGEALDGCLETVAAKEGLVAVPVIRVSAYTDLTFNDGRFLYNLEVEGNHNYFANRTLVGNSDKNDEFWDLLQAGESIPTPKVPFVFKKFESYLKGMGLDIDKQGNDLILQPLTDKKTLEMSNGELTNAAATLVGRNLKPEPGGIFDPVVTGTKGIGLLGDKWGHITLAERIPNPVFEKPVMALLGLTAPQYRDIINSKKEYKGKTGPAAIVEALRSINIKTEAKELESKIPDLREAKLNQATRKLRYLRTLENSGLRPTEAYTIKHVPVIPPVMRPVMIRDNGQLNSDGLNKLYNLVAATNDKLKEFNPKVMPEDEAHPLRSELYDGVKALELTGTVNHGRQLNSIATIISGEGQPKEGFFQDKVIGKRQDLSMRGTIVPEPSLSLDEVGIPRKAAQEIYKPFIVQRLTLMGMKPRQAQNEVKLNTEAAAKALENVMAERPLLLKRDPVLHKFGVQAFKPKIVEGKAIKIHPLATSGYNADFDGDKMSAFVPVSPKAVKEAYKMLPSNNLFSPANGFLMFKPTQESMMGLYKLTQLKPTSAIKQFKDVVEAARAANDGKIQFNDPITVRDLKSLGGLDKLGAGRTTTLGRLLVYNTLPPELRSEKVLYDPKYQLDKKNLTELLSNVAEKNKGDFSRVADRLKDMGNSFSTGMSISLNDFVSHAKDRDALLEVVKKEEARIRASSKLNDQKKDEEIVKLYSEAGRKLDSVVRPKIEASGNRMYDWVKSGAKGNWDQFKQMTVAPILVADATGRAVPVPITKSYSEGLDIGSYWTAMHGARMGTINRVEGTWRPGLAGKQIMQATMDQLVVGEDCGTTTGIKMAIDNRDILGRFTVGDIALGSRVGKDKGVIPSGTLVTPDILNRLRNNKVHDIRIRTPLKCAHGRGICSKCYGINESGQLHEPGVNVGVIAAQALGEPATQLSMNAFHTGGVIGAKGTAASNTFDRLNQLLGLPAKLPGSAVLSTADGKVEKVEKDPAGGWNVYVKGQRHYVPGSRELLVRTGESVKKGESLTSGPKNPREMLKLTGLNSVQSYLVNELQSVYKNESPLSRRNTEAFVRAMTNLSRIKDPGSHPEFLRGDYAPTSELEDFNRKLPKDKKIVVHTPVLKAVNMLPLDLQEDWIARLQSQALRKTIIDAASEGWRSMLHSTHPIPGMAYGKEFGKGTDKEPWLY